MKNHTTSLRLLVINPNRHEKEYALLITAPLSAIMKYCKHFHDFICNHWYNGHFPRRRQLHRE